jgi:secreted trypsin-like serine protease
MSTRKPPVVVLLGAVNLNEPGFTAQTYHVKKWVQHPEYSTARVYNDIAVIELDRTVKFSENIQPACLYTKSEIPNNGLEVTGWGATSNTRKFMRCLISDIKILVTITYAQNYTMKNYFVI